MCFFSEKCLKKTLGILAFVVAFLGIGIIVIGSILLSEQSSNEIFSEGNDNGFLIFASIVLSLGIVTLLLGIAGIYGGFKKQRCCICLYNISLFPSTVIFLGLGIAAVVSANWIFENMESDLSFNARNNCNYYNASSCHCGENSDFLFWIKDVNSYISTSVLPYYGNNAEAIVDISKNPNLFFYLTQNQIVKLNPLFVNNGTGSLRDTKPQYLSASEWIQSNKSLNPNVGYNVLMQYLETTFDCSGMCAPVPFYLFSNTYETQGSRNLTRNVMEHGSCYESVYDFFNGYAVAIYATLFSVGSFFLIQIILSVSLCCKREKKDTSFYKRMDYLD